MLISLGFAALAAVAVGIATTAVVRLQHLEAEEATRQLEAYKSEAATKISAADAKGQTAEAEAAKAQAQIEEARARQKEAELKLEQLRKQIAPRRLNREEFISDLSTQPKAPTEVMYLRDDPESFEFAQEIAFAMQEAGWEITSRRPIPPSMDPDAITAMSVGGQPSGVTVVTSSLGEGEITASFNAMVGRPWVKTAFTVLSNALQKSLGGIATSAGGPNSPAPGTLRVVVAPKKR
ncbi:hypothetical protein [Bradyrhizobium sp. C-145]|uniref:hypothetical protein n=1 Tax=unclassified Bradyrhizobium TaxID=2631580 RepID=UPI00201B80F4|nr:hypothetical protein [Bradyrhizobium sp. C-145]UQR67319.1 hypothetical protein LRP30_19550 [Bradyrhizobium sp. C-145]